MKRGLIRLDFLLYCANETKFRPFEKINQRCLTASLLLLFSAAFTLIKGQTVNYSYDSSGNVISKTVIQPQESASFSIENNSIQLLNNSLADNQIKIYAEPEDSSTTQVNELFETLAYDANVTFPKEETPMTSSLSVNAEWFRIVVDRERNNGPN